MNYRLRLVQFVLLGLTCLFILLYTSHNEASHEASIQLHFNPLINNNLEKMSKKKTIGKLEEEDKNTGKVAKQVPSNKPGMPIKKANSSAPAGVKAKNPVNLIPINVNSDANNTQLVQDVYESGHVIPNSGLCPNLGSSLKLLILITSSPDHLDARIAIRQTWGFYTHQKTVRIAFVVGMSFDGKVNKALKQESEEYSDLIQCSFVDSYNNLTLKSISMLEWVDNYCPRVSFVLKTDDDMFINVPKLLTFISKHSEAKRVIYGRLAKGWKPVRNPTSKYRVSTSQFSAAVLPDFTTGPAYLLSSDTVHDLYTNALNMSYLKLEDVFVTGVVAGKLGIKRIHANEFLNRKVPLNACNVRNSISIHMIKQFEQFALWEKMHDSRIRCK